MFVDLKSVIATLDHLPPIPKMFTKEPTEAFANVNLTGRPEECKGTVWNKGKPDFANTVCDALAAQVNLHVVGDVKPQGRVPGGSTTKHDDTVQIYTNQSGDKVQKRKDDLRMIVSVNTLMEMHTDACVFWWKTPQDTAQAHIMPCHVLQFFVHQASSPEHPGCSWVCDLAAN